MFRQDFSYQAGGDGCRDTRARLKLGGRRVGGRLTTLFLIGGLVISPVLAQAQTVSYEPASVPTEAQVEAALSGQSTYTAGEIASAIRNFLQHKDEPDQAPVGTPVALVFVAAFLLFLPSIIGTCPGSTVCQEASPLEAPMSCPVFAGETAVITEDGCVWTKVTRETVDFDEATNTATILSGGGQTQFAPDWFIGGAFQFLANDAEQDGGLGLQGHGQGFNGSLALKHIEGPWLFAASIALGSSSFSLDPAGPLEQTDIDAFGAGLRLRAAYDVDMGRWYIRPRIDVDGVYSSIPDFQMIAGNQVANVDGTDSVSFDVTPNIEIGGRIDLEWDMILRPYLSAGMAFMSNPATTTTFSLAAADIGTGTFAVEAGGPSVLVQMEAGVQLYQEHGFEIETAYDLSAGDAFTAQSLSLRGAWHF